MVEGQLTDKGRKIPISILIDSGADRDFIASELIHKAALPVQAVPGRKEWVKVANGQLMKTPGISRCNLTMGGYTCRITA